MVDYRKYALSRGLTVVTHHATDTPMAAVGMLVAVGSRDEDSSRTGFAHLFEHLMFGGTETVPDYDRCLSLLGGESNAFTNDDYTYYHSSFPAMGLQEVLNMEADRLAHLALTPSALQVQQQVVTEEYKQRYLGRPYGDMWLQLRPLCYTQHPYRWPTIGADISHVRDATLEDVRSFHQRWYHSANTILAIASPYTHSEMLHMVEQAFGEQCVDDVAAGEPVASQWRKRRYPVEPLQTAPRRLEISRHVPADAVYIAYPMGDRWSGHYHVCDMISDILANGNSSRLYRRLVMKGTLVSEADAQITGEEGPGLLLLSARLLSNANVDDAIEALRHEAQQLVLTQLSRQELNKVANKYESTFFLSQYKATDRVMSLCHNTWLGRTEWVNDEPLIYRSISPIQLQQTAEEIFRPERENILVIKKI